MLIEGEEIVGIGREEVLCPPQAETIVASGWTVMPGLIDAHVHLRTPAVKDRLAYEVKTPPALKAFYIAENARRTLEAGFTTLRDTGSSVECIAEGDESWWRNYTLGEIRAITDEAHALGRRVAAHAHGEEGIKNAILGGVDTIEHGIYLDDELLEIWSKGGYSWCRP